MSYEHTRIDVPGTSNLRDLGGLPAGDGWVIAPGKLLRGEAMVFQNSDTYAVYSAEADVELAKLGLSTVVDLRAEHEAGRAPSAWADVCGARLVALPIAEGGEGADTNYIRMLLDGEIECFDSDSMAEFYVQMLQRRAEPLGAAFRLLADPSNLPLLVHCAAGKDRTGILVALVLLAVGVPDSVVVEEYSLTQILRPNRVDSYAHLFVAAGRDPEIGRVLFESPSSAMVSTLSYLQEEFGGVVGYLTGPAGVSGDDIGAVRKNLLVPAST